MPVFEGLGLRVRGDMGMQPTACLCVSDSNCSLLHISHLCLPLSVSVGGGGLPVTLST